MLKASRAFASGWGGLPAGIQTSIPEPRLPAELVGVAERFVQLQEARHEADYDLSQRFVKQEAVNFVQKADEAFDFWTRVRREPAARCYLLCLLMWPRLQGRT